MLRISSCGVLVLFVAACGGPEAGSPEVLSQEAQGPRILQVVELRDPLQGGKEGFGRVVALAEGTLVVAEPINYGFGHVHVFGPGGSTWVHQASLQPPVAGPAWSGWVIAAARGTVAVGAGTNGDAAVHIYERTKAGWVHAETLSAPPGAVNFGTSLAMDETHLLAGGRVGLRGAVWSFERTAGGWIPNGEIPSPFVHDYDQWGASMALTPTRAVISDPSVRWVPRFNGGVAIFDRSASGWLLTECIEEELAEVGFGVTVAASGTRVAISGFTGEPTHVWNIDDDERWEETECDESDVDSAYDQALAMSEDLLVVGAGGSDDAGVEAEGAVYVYFRTETGWSAPTVLRSPEEHGYLERFGRGIAVSGSLIAIGAPGAEELGADEDSGEVYLYEVKRTNPRR